MGDFNLNWTTDDIRTTYESWPYWLSKSGILIFRSDLARRCLLLLPLLLSYTVIHLGAPRQLTWAVFPTVWIRVKVIKKQQAARQDHCHHHATYWHVCWKCFFTWLKCSWSWPSNMYKVETTILFWLTVTYFKSALQNWMSKKKTILSCKESWGRGKQPSPFSVL